MATAKKKDSGAPVRRQPTVAQARAAMRRHKADYDAYQVARAEAREGKRGAAIRQERLRPGYTAFKRAQAHPALVAERAAARAAKAATG